MLKKSPPVRKVASTRPNTGRRDISDNGFAGASVRALAGGRMGTPRGAKETSYLRIQIPE